MPRERSTIKNYKLFSVCCWLFVASTLIAAPHPIVFVHLGEASVPCLFTTMKQARTFNPKSAIYLLTDRKAHRLFEAHQEFLDDERIVLVNMDLIEKTPQHCAFCETDPFSKDFWAYTSERFFVLFDFVQDQGLENVVHLESDTMLYVDLEELEPLFKDFQLAAPFQSLVGCIPCFVWIKNAKSLSLLLDHMLFEMGSYQGNLPQSAVNDMQTLASFYRKFGTRFLMPLPTLMPEYGKHHRKRRSRFGPDNATPLGFLSMSASLFPNYLFDAAGLGIFFNGNDRRLCPQHGPGTVHARSLFDPRYFSFVWGEDAEGRAAPYLLFEGKDYRIINLHFHSKMPEEYTSFQATRAEMPIRRHP